MLGKSAPAAKWLWLLGLLIVANVGYYYYNNWGLVTVKVKDAPLGQVIKSIEWQGWVKIYTNMPLDTKVTMYADHVPLADAMETLAVNVDVPPPPDGDDNPRPRREGFGAFGNQGATNSAAASPPNGSGPNGSPTVVQGGQGGQPGGGPPGGRGGGGFGRGAQWNLAFFVARTPAQVQQEVREFQSSDPDDNNKVYAYGSQMGIFAADTTTTAPDPRLQSWPGYKPPPPAPPPTDPQASTNAAPNQASGDQPDPNAPPTMHTYLQALAAGANIWIMAPGSWAPPVASPPPQNSSIISAVKNLVYGSHGAVTEAFVLRAGRGGAAGNRGGFANDDAWEDRMRNAISGLPPDERADAVEQLNKEVDFRKQLQALPPEQRRQKMMEHFIERMLYADRSRLSPEKRARGYQRMVAARAAAKGQ